jgi:hypothetical protein
MHCPSNVLERNKLLPRKSDTPIKLALLFLFLLPVVSSKGMAQSPASEAKEKSCRTHPLLIGRCFSVRGRLSIYNGSPARRLWRIGTKRMLGISEQRFFVEGFRNVPEDMENKLNEDVAIFGDFVVCPFTRSKAGEMQLICIEEGKNLAVRKRE